MLHVYSVPGLAMRPEVMEIISTFDQADTVPGFSHRQDSEKPVLPEQKTMGSYRRFPNDNGTAGRLRRQDIQAVLKEKELFVLHQVVTEHE